MKLTTRQAAGDFTTTSPTTTARLLQQCIDGLPRMDGVISHSPQGGAVRLPAGAIDLGKTPLYVDGLAQVQGFRVLDGTTRDATLLRYSGEGAAVRPRCYADHEYNMGTTICNLAIEAPNGDGIAFDEGIASSNYLRIEHVKISAGATGIRLRPESDNAYCVRIDDVLIVDAGEMALDLKASVVTIRDFCAFINRKMSGPAMVRLSGGVGSTIGGRLEGQPGIPARLIDGGEWDLIGDYIECYAKDVPQQIVENAHVNQSFLRWIRSDCKYRIGDGGTLKVTFPADGAITPDGTPTRAADCFDVASTGRLFVNHQLMLNGQTVTQEAN